MKACCGEVLTKHIWTHEKSLGRQPIKQRHPTGKNVATICLETSLEKELCIMPNSEIEPWKLGKQLNFLRSTYVAIKFWKK